MRELARFGRLGERFQRAHAPQQREHALGDERAVVLAHLRVRAEERAQAVVGRHVEAAHALDRGAERRELVGANASLDLRLVDADRTEQDLDRAAVGVDHPHLHRNVAKRRREPDVGVGLAVVAAAMPALGVDRALLPSRSSRFPRA